MAKKMSYTDPQSGAVFSGSVWLPLGVFNDFSVPNGNIVFLGYANEEIARKKLMAILGIPGGEHKSPIGSKSYPLSAEKSRILAMTPGGENILNTLSETSYAVAMDELDVPAPTEEEPDRKVSFFHEATDVVLL